jgi:hypothetical protein
VDQSYLFIAMNVKCVRPAAADGQNLPPVNALADGVAFP